MEQKPRQRKPLNNDLEIEGKSHHYWILHKEEIQGT
jgi:hypothetical protein